MLFFKKSEFFCFLRHMKRQISQYIGLIQWRKNGCPAPPPHRFKQKVLKKYAMEFGLKIFVETGTYMGDMCHAMSRVFDEIYSIELDKGLFDAAEKRFKAKKHIKIIHGDSGVEIARLLPGMDKPVLFFLDGHYSGGVTGRGKQDTPIINEINAILGGLKPGVPYIILIDDARCFGADPAYPSFKDVKELVYARVKSANVSVKDDIIRVIPKR